MSGHDQTEVLVVGAGPVGLLTALVLAEGGVKVTIIDEEWRTAAHSYACALHPGTLQLLEQFELAAPLLRLGHRVNTVAFREGERICARMHYQDLAVRHPCLLVVPQSAFESLLEQRLQERHGVKVRWNHRLSDLKTNGEAVMTTIDRLGGTATGLVVPRWELVVKRRDPLATDFVVGADGRGSVVRQRLGIDWQPCGDPLSFSVFECKSAGRTDNELNVMLSGATTDVVWPMPDGKCRWSFQRLPDAEPLDAPSKDRHPVRFYESAEDEATLERLRGLVKARAPWFQGEFGELGWSIEVEFEPRLAARFGQGRTWLVGDAAHQTSPVGMQSMNLGLSEAVDLAMKLRAAVVDHAPLETLEKYNRDRHQAWEFLLGVRNGLKANDQATEWVREKRARILSCVPASGEHLKVLLHQIGLDVPKCPETNGVSA